MEKCILGNGCLPPRPQKEDEDGRTCAGGVGRVGVRAVETMVTETVGGAWDQRVAPVWTQSAHARS